MKKRLLLSIAVLMTAVITAQAEDYPIYFDNDVVRVTDANKDNLTTLLTDAGLLTAGTVTFSTDGSTPKLTLNGVKLKALNGSYYTTLAIGGSMSLILELVGENEILYDVDKTWGYPLACGVDTKVTLTGSGSLTCKAVGSPLHKATYLKEGATLVIDGNATLISIGYNQGVAGDTNAKLVINYGTLKASGAYDGGRGQIEVRGGIQLGEGVSVTQPAGARISDDGIWVLNADGSGIPTSTEVVITGGSPSGIVGTTVSAQHDGTRYNLQGQRVGEEYRGVVIENGRKHVIK